MVVKVVPPSVETCHWTVGVGVPVAAAVKLADWPCTTATSAGEAVTVGGESTVRVAADVVTDPMELATTARYSFPLSPAVVVSVRVPEVAPTTLVKVVPPSVETCHWMSGDGLPLPAAVKLAGWPALTVTPSAGWTPRARCRRIRRR